MISITFKEVYTENIHEYKISPEWTTEELYNNLGYKIRNDFNINLSELELIDTLSFLNNGRPTETLPAIPYSSVTKLWHLWGHQLKNLTMYIRKKNTVLPPQIQRIIDEIDECMVCLNECRIKIHYQCIHRLCDNCYRGCVSHNIITCPMCRCR
jgi:hypothetical protein